MACFGLFWGYLGRLGRTLEDGLASTCLCQTVSGASWVRLGPRLGEAGALEGALQDGLAQDITCQICFLDFRRLATSHQDLGFLRFGL